MKKTMCTPLASNVKFDVAHALTCRSGIRTAVSDPPARMPALHAKACATVLLLLAVAAHAQWLNYPTAGMPRTPDGKPNLSAPTPNSADGKPDLSGLWEPMGEASSSFAGSTARDPKFADIALGMKDGLPLQPWAADLVKA